MSQSDPPPTTKARVEAIRQWAECCILNPAMGNGPRHVTTLLARIDHLEAGLALYMKLRTGQVAGELGYLDQDAAHAAIDEWERIEKEAESC